MYTNKLVTKYHQLGESTKTDSMLLLFL